MEKLTLNEFLKVNDLQGKVIVFPTDTVYGIGCLYGDEEAKEKIYNIKKRDYGKPLPVLVSNMTQAKQISCIEHVKYTNLWPGALTIIVNSKPYKDFKVLSTIALRMPDSKIALRIIDHFGPLYTTSCNYSGEKEFSSISEIESNFKDKIDYLIVDKQDFSKIPSTIIDCTKDIVKVIRQGGVIINNI